MNREYFPNNDGKNVVLMPIAILKCVELFRLSQDFIFMFTNTRLKLKQAFHRCYIETNVLVVNVSYKIMKLLYKYFLWFRMSFCMHLILYKLLSNK